MNCLDYVNDAVESEKQVIMRTFKYILTAAVVLVLALQGFAAVVVIDDYTVGDVDLIVDGLIGDDQTGTTNETQTGLSTDHILGGQRETTLNVTDTDTAGATDRSRLYIEDNVMRYNVDSSMTANWEMVYEGMSQTTGADLLDADNDRLRFIFTSADQDIDFEVTVTDTDGNTDVETRTTPARWGSTKTLEYTFSSFSSSVDWDKIRNITVNTTSTGSPDFIMNNFTAVPEPLSMGLFGIVGAFIIYIRRFISKRG